MLRSAAVLFFLPMPNCRRELRHIGVVVEIDMHTGRILQAECTLATKLASDFIAKMLVGYNMNDGLDELNAMIEKHYQASAKKAVLTAVRMLNDKFISHKNGEGIDYYD